MNLGDAYKNEAEGWIQIAAGYEEQLTKVLAIIDGELKFYQEEYDHGNLTEVGQHAHSVLRGIRKQISAVLISPADCEGKNG
jgi:hypothetical protein